MANSKVGSGGGEGDNNGNLAGVAALVERFQDSKTKSTRDAASDVDTPSPKKRTPNHKAFGMFQNSGMIMGMPAPPRLLTPGVSSSPRVELSGVNKQDPVVKVSALSAHDSCEEGGSEFDDITSSATLKHLTPSRPKVPARRKPTRSIHHSMDTTEDEMSKVKRFNAQSWGEGYEPSIKREIFPALEAAVNSFALDLAQQMGYISCTVAQEDINSFADVVVVRYSYPDSRPQCFEVEAPISHSFHVIGIAAGEARYSKSHIVAAVGVASMGVVVGGAVGLLGGPIGVAAGATLGGFIGGGIGSLIPQKASRGKDDRAGGGGSERGEFVVTLKEVFKEGHDLREDADKGVVCFKTHAL